MSRIQKIVESDSKKTFHETKLERARRKSTEGISSAVRTGRGLLNTYLNKLDEIIEIVRITNLAGVVATNTTTSRKELKTEGKVVDEIGNGGLSGQPLKNKSTEVIRYLAQKSNKAFPIIGVGGIHSAEDALEKLEAGADLVQLYTGFIYEGPSLIKKINRKILSNSNN